MYSQLFVHDGEGKGSSRSVEPGRKGCWIRANPEEPFFSLPPPPPLTPPLFPPPKVKDRFLSLSSRWECFCLKSWRMTPLIDGFHRGFFIALQRLRDERKRLNCRSNSSQIGDFCGCYFGRASETSGSSASRFQGSGRIHGAMRGG